MNLSEIETKIKGEFNTLRDELERLFGTHREVSQHINNAEAAVIEHATSVPASEGAGEPASAEPASDAPASPEASGEASTEA